MRYCNMVEIYTTPTCHYCGIAKEFFKKHNIEFTEKNAAEPANKQKVLELTGKLSVPVVVDGNKVIQGFDEQHFKDHFGVEE